MELLNGLIDNYNIPVLSAFVLGVLTSISPCPLATNITAIAFISKDLQSPKRTIISGAIYTLGRGISYVILASLIYLGASSFQLSRIFQGWGDLVLGPFLIVIGLIMSGLIRINFNNQGAAIVRIKSWLATKGYWGSLALGLIFAFAFCPYSGVMFFGVLIPMMLKTSVGLLLPPIFALGTGLPVIIFAVLIAGGAGAIGRIFKTVRQIEKWLRYSVSAVFIGAGIYYSQFLILHFFR